MVLKNDFVPRREILRGSGVSYVTASRSTATASRSIRVGPPSSCARPRARYNQESDDERASGECFRLPHRLRDHRRMPERGRSRRPFRRRESLAGREVSLLEVPLFFVRALTLLSDVVHCFRRCQLPSGTGLYPRPRKRTRRSVGVDHPRRDLSRRASTHHRRCSERDETLVVCIAPRYQRFIVVPNRHKVGCKPDVIIIVIGTRFFAARWARAFPLGRWLPVASSPLPSLRPSRSSVILFLRLLPSLRPCATRVASPRVRRGDSEASLVGLGVGAGIIGRIEPSEIISVSCRFIATGRARDRDRDRGRFFLIAWGGSSIGSGFGCSFGNQEVRLGLAGFSVSPHAGDCCPLPLAHAAPARPASSQIRQAESLLSVCVLRDQHGSPAAGVILHALAGSGASARGFGSAFRGSRLLCECRPLRGGLLCGRNSLVCPRKFGWRYHALFRLDLPRSLHLRSDSR